MLRLLDGKADGRDIQRQSPPRIRQRKSMPQKQSGGHDLANAATNNSELKDDDDKLDFLYATKSKFEIKCNKMDMQTKLMELNGHIKLNNFRHKMKSKTNSKAQSRTTSQLDITEQTLMPVNVINIQPDQQNNNRGKTQRLRNSIGAAMMEQPSFCK